jgi:hypothetical protein
VVRLRAAYVSAGRTAMSRLSGAIENQRLPAAGVKARWLAGMRQSSTARRATGSREEPSISIIRI